MAIDEAETPTHSAAAESPCQPRRPAQAPVTALGVNVIGIAVILGICYYAELVLVVILVSILLAFVLAPVVEFLRGYTAPCSGLGNRCPLAASPCGRNRQFFLQPGSQSLPMTCPKYTTKFQEIFTVPQKGGSWAVPSRTGQIKEPRRAPIGATC